SERPAARAQHCCRPGRAKASIVQPGAAARRSQTLPGGRMDFKHIEAFVWVAELRNFRLAAEKLHTTRPAIPQRIAALAATLAVRLFDRGARGIRLTEKGQELQSKTNGPSRSNQAHYGVLVLASLPFM